MEPIEDLVTAVLARDHLRARSLVQDFARAGIDLAQSAAPRSASVSVRTMAAALVALFAERKGVPAPTWTNAAGAFSEPFYTDEPATRSARLRARWERDAPEALRRRKVFAEPNVLTFV